MQWQIVAQDPDAVARFYGDLFGWKVRTDNALGYRTVASGGDHGIDGGIWPAPPGAHTLLQLFIEVGDIDASIERASSLGATVIVPKSVLPDGDALAILRDPAGLTFGVMQSKQ
jgi:predicted enzyme related to lactoylglutathione lyase